MIEKPEILAVTTLARTRLFEIEQVDLRFSNGREVQFERLQSHSSEAVLVIPLDGEELVLIREYAVGTERYELGFPKGSIDANEDPATAGNRELREEIGYAARKFEHLRRIVMSPAYFNHASHILLATDLYKSPLQGDEPEPMERIRWPLSRMWELPLQDEFTDARNHIALYLLGDALGVKK